MDGVSHDHKSLNRLYGNQKVASGGSNLKFEWHPEVHRFSQMGIRRFSFWSDFWAWKKMTTKS